MAKNTKEYMREYMKNYRNQDKKNSKKDIENNIENIVIKANNKIKKELKEIFIGEDKSPTLIDLIDKIAYNSSLIEYINEELKKTGFTYVTNSGTIKSHPLNTILTYADNSYRHNMKLLYKISDVEEDE